MFALIKLGLWITEDYLHDWEKSIVMISRRYRMVLRNYTYKYIPRFESGAAANAECDYMIAKRITMSNSLGL